MELWIRSQDKSMLVKVNEISMHSNARTDLRSWEILVNDYSFGDYATTERAKKVLDEIQNILKPKPILQAKPMLSRETMKRIQNDYDMTVLPSCVDAIEPISTSFVYEMPEE